MLDSLVKVTKKGRKSVAGSEVAKARKNSENK